LNPDSIVRWDADIIAAYLVRRRGSRDVPLIQCPLTLQATVLHRLDAAVGDVVARTAAKEDNDARNMTAIDALRSATFEVALERYVNAVGAAKRPTQSAESRVADHIEQSLMLRSQRASRPELLGIELEVPASLRSALDGFLKGQMEERLDHRDVAEWPGDLLDDVRSAVAEAVALEWITMRANVYPTGAAISLDTRRSSRLGLRLPQRRRGDRRHSAEAE
jgi:hypothetical protein